jgi:hypothetical protein
MQAKQRVSAPQRSQLAVSTLSVPRRAHLPLIDTREGAMLVYNHRESGECRSKALPAR